MLFYNHSRKSVLCSFVGTMLTLFGIVGLLCYIFSKSTQRLDGCVVADANDVKRLVNRHGKVCVLANIMCDDNIFMPDTGERVVKGSVTLSLRWPDGTESILLNWNGAASYLKPMVGDTALSVSISPECVECVATNIINPEDARISVDGNRFIVSYCGRNYTVGGRIVRGDPELQLSRQYLLYGSRVAMVIEKTATNYYEGSGYKVSRITAYQNAKQRHDFINGVSVIFLALIFIGILLFFVPEPKYKG